MADYEITGEDLDAILDEAAAAITDATAPAGGNIWNETVTEAMTLGRDMGSAFVFSGESITEGIRLSRDTEGRLIFSPETITETMKMQEAAAIRMIFGMNVVEAMPMGDLDMTAMLRQALSAIDRPYFKGDAREGKRDIYTEAVSEIIRTQDLTSTVASIFGAVASIFKFSESISLPTIHAVLDDMAFALMDETGDEVLEEYDVSLQFDESVTERFSTQVVTSAFLRLYARAILNVAVADQSAANIVNFVQVLQKWAAADRAVEAPYGQVYNEVISIFMRIFDEPERTIYRESARDAVQLTESMKAQAISWFSSVVATTFAAQLKFKAKFYASIISPILINELSIATARVALSASALLEMEDSTEARLIYSRAVDALLRLLDQVQAEVPPAIVFHDDVTDAFRLIEAMKLQAAYSQDVTDRVALESIVSAYASLYSIIVSSFRLGDFAIPFRPFNEFLSETLLLNEQLAIAIYHGFAGIESISVEDVSTASITINLSVTEPVAVADVMAAMMRFAAHITENFTAGEVLVATRIRPTIEIRRGRTFIFTIDTVGPQTGVAPKKGRKDVKKWH